MTCPDPTFAGSIAAVEGLAWQVAATLGEPADPAGVYSVEQVLAALIQGGSIREEWGVRVTWPSCGIEDMWSADTSRAFAERRIAAHVASGWRTDPTLIRRFVVVTAGRPYEETR